MAIAHGHGRLKKDALSLGHIVASTLANIAPAMSFFFGFAVIVQGAGLASPLTIIVALIGILFLANTLSEFTRYIPSTGSFVTFMGKAFGPAAGTCVAVFVTIGYIVAAASVVNIAGGWTETTIQKYLHIDIPWQILSALSCLIVGWMVAKGVHMSTRWAAIFFYFETGLLLIGAVLMLIINRQYITLEPFMWSKLNGGISGIGLGFPLAIYLFIGWENSAMLAEETVDPRRNIPRALFSSTLIIGVFYVFLAYATSIGFHNDAVAIGKSSIPYVDALQASVGGAIILAYLAGVTSTFSSLIGLTNAQARILFNSGREGMLPEIVGKIHPDNQTPFVATWVFLAVALALVFIFGWKAAPTDFFGEIATMGTIPVVLVYIGTNLALPVYMMRHHRAALKPVRHVVVPLLGVLAMIYPLWGLVQPGQPSPFNLFPYIALAILVASILYGVLLSKARPGLAERIGSNVADR